MDKTKRIALYALWACFYILCVGMGTVSPNGSAGTVALVLLSVVFFLPGYWLAWGYLRQKDRKGLRLLRVICAASLLLTLAALVANFLAANASQSLGAVLHDVLQLVSAPMLCSQYWVLSLFLWACLLMITIPGVILPRQKK